MTSDEQVSRDAVAPRPTGPDDAARRRRRDRVFGDVLPDSTSDDRDPVTRGGAHDTGRNASEPEGGSSSDEWLRANVPPHHG